MNIISAGPGDFDSVYALICKLEETAFDRRAMLEVYTRNLADDNVHYILAVDGPRIVGFASLHIQLLLHHACKIAEIQEMIVSDDMRGAGIGKALLGRLKEIAALNGCAQLEACCNRRRIQSHEFYLKQGAKGSHFKFIIELNHT